MNVLLVKLLLKPIPTAVLAYLISGDLNTFIVGEEVQRAFFDKLPW